MSLVICCWPRRLATTVALNTGRPAGMRRTDNSIGAKQNKAEAVSGADTEPKPRHNVVGPPSRDASLERASCQAIHPRKGLLQLQLLAWSRQATRPVTLFTTGKTGTDRTQAQSMMPLPGPLQTCTAFLFDKDSGVFTYWGRHLKAGQFGIK